MKFVVAMGVRVGAAMSIVALLGIAATFIALTTAPASAQSPMVAKPRGTSASQDFSAQRRRGTQLRVYRQTLSPNAVRACVDWYELEYRPSGTVLVPRMRCHWVNG